MPELPTASVPLYNAVQGTAGRARATSQTGDSRMQALGAATTGYNAYKTYEAAQNPLGYKVGAMLSDSHSQSSSTQSSRTAVGSTVSGAGNVNITAIGGGADSNLTATAASISGNNVSLNADNAVTLQSARSTSDYDYQQSGSKYGVGVSYSVGAQNGVTIDLAAGSNRGTGSGSDSTNVNTYVTATNTATIKSGGNTTLDGAVVQAETVKAEVGGDLRIQSEQDTSTAAAKQSGSGFDASICYFWCVGAPVVASGSVSSAGGNGRYASVTEQSGIQAGDGGFDVKVEGNTNLVGGVMASTDQAVDGGKNGGQGQRQLCAPGLRSGASERSNRLRIVSTQRIDQRSRIDRQARAVAHQQVALAHAPRVAQLDQRQLHALLVAAHGGFGHHADADAAADHSAHGVEAGELDAQLLAPAEVLGDLRQEGVQRAALLHADRVFVQRLGEGDAAAAREAVLA